MFKSKQNSQLFLRILGREGPPENWLCIMHWLDVVLLSECAGMTGWKVRRRRSAFYLYRRYYYAIGDSNLQKFRFVLKSVSVEASDVRNASSETANGRMKGILQPSSFRGAGVGHHTTRTIALPLHLRSHHLQQKSGNRQINNFHSFSKNAFCSIAI